MTGRVMLIGGWRAYLLGAVILTLLLVALFAASVVVVTLLAVGAVALVAHRVLRALGLARPRPRGGERIVEGEYRVVERRLSDRAEG